MLSDIVVLVVLVMINAFFAAAEIALLSVNVNKVRIKAEQGDKKAILMKKTIDEPNNFLSTIQIGISLAGLFSGAFAASAFAEPIVTYLIGIGVSLPESVLNTITILVITLILSYFSLVIGELVPKRIAMNNPESIAAVMVQPIHMISVITMPFVKVLSFSTNCILRLVGIDPNDNEKDVTEEEIRMMVEVSGDKGSIDMSEREMINNIFEFDNKSVDEISTHRTDILALDINASREEVISSAVNERYSRIPVYEDNIDNIIGILHLKDFLNYIFTSKNSDHDDINLREIIRSAYFVPVSKKTDQLFDEMKKSKVHMAIVVDEYGGTAGLVTMEDLLEEIVGNIYDEYDEEEMPDIDKLDENTFLVDGTADLTDIEEFFGVELPTEDYDTISGFIIGQIGRIPSEEEQPEIEFGGLVFKVYKVQEKRVASVVVCRV